MRCAIWMDGAPPSRVKTVRYEGGNTDTYRNTPEFARALEDLGAKGRAADAYLGGVTVQTEFGSGDVLVMDPARYSITRIPNK